ncbi:MAG: sulfate transporter CysZ [Gammaproteobacteria bacterium]
MMIRDFTTGAGYLLKGFALLGKPGIKRYVMIPLLINILLFTALVWLLSDQFGLFIDWLTPSLPDWLAWLTWLLWVVFALVALLLIFFSFSVIANLVGAPFNSYLAAAVEQYLSGTKPAGGNLSLPVEIIKSVKSETNKILYALLWLIPLLIISIIPGINIIAPVLWAWFGAWILAIEYADYPLGNYGLGFSEVKAKLKQHRWLALGFGGAVTLATLIPLVNLLVMPTAVAGATRMRLEKIPLAKATDDG